jgi:hypothetical protein
MVAVGAGLAAGSVTDCDDALQGLETLLSILRERVDLRAEFCRFLDKKPVFAFAEFEDVGAAVASASISVPRLQMTDEFRVFMATLGARANERDAHVFRRGVSSHFGLRS